MKLISSKNWEEAGVTAGPSARGTLDAIIMEMCQEQGVRMEGPWEGVEFSSEGKETH